MDLRDRFGANLRKLRRLHALSQEALSLKAGLERGYVGRLERSQYYTSMVTVQKLALALKVDPIELIEPVLITPGKTSITADYETSDVQKGLEGSHYRWNDGSTVRRWLVNPKKVKQSAVVLKSCTPL